MEITQFITLAHWVGGALLLAALFGLIDKSNAALLACGCATACCLCDFFVRGGINDRLVYDFPLAVGMLMLSFLLWLVGR